MSRHTVLKRITLALAGGAIALAAQVESTLAQGLFDPVAQVDQLVITEFEVQQRSRFLQLLNAQGLSRQETIQGLIQDRLRAAEARRVGSTIDDAALQQGLAEFAGRANLTLDQFVAALEQEGVAPETFRDFIGIQLTWRDYINARFGARVQITDREIDRALESANGAGGIEVLVSEIIIPAPPEDAQQVLAQAEQISQTTSTAEFSNFARRFSATESRGSGGQLPWTPLGDLPPVLRPLLLALSTGEVTAPLPIPNAVALFQLRGIRETTTQPPSFETIEYAALYIAGGRTPETLGRAREISARIDRCDDLYGIAQGQPENVLDRGSLPPAEIPTDIALELSKLDPGETSTALTRANGNTLVLLMLCGRTAAAKSEQEVDREAIATQIRNQRLTTLSQSLLDELEAEANIRIFQ